MRERDVERRRATLRFHQGVWRNQPMLRSGCRGSAGPRAIQWQNLAETWQDLRISSRVASVDGIMESLKQDALHNGNSQVADERGSRSRSLSLLMRRVAFTGHLPLVQPICFRMLSYTESRLRTRRASDSLDTAVPCPPTP